MIIKYDTSGNEIFNKTWGGPQYEIGKYIFEDISGNFYVSGETCSLGDLNGDALIIKFNNLFEEIWNATWGGSELDIANKAEIGSNNYLYVVGHSNSVDPDPGYSDVFLLKYDLDGNYQWVRTWGTSYDQRGNSLALDSNDNIYITGYSFGHPASSGKGFLLKYDSNGNYQWERIWGVNGQYGNYFYRIIINANDDLYISGCTKTYGIPNNYDALLLNYDTSGNQNWNRIWMGSGVDATPGICMDSRSNIYIVGYTETNSSGGTDVLLIKFKNDNEITIITPENKTYIQPDNGYYPATYGFENIINGQDHPDWNDLSLQKGNVISEMDGHKKVYEVTDNSESSAADLLEYYDIQSHGTIEFWCRFTSATAGNYYRLSGLSTLGPTLNIYLNEFLFTNSSGSYPLPGAPIPQVNKWYHVRFDFRGSYSSEYSGLSSQYTYFIYINMIKYGPFTYEENGDLDTFQVHTSIAGSGFTIWWDAVGYSWDPAYGIGDNLNEGLLLSYENATILDWQGYSIDGASNKTILGNTVIPFPTDGQHRIQVFGNDSFGNIYESDLRHFSTDSTSPYISINLPVQQSYFGNTAPLFDLTISGKNLSTTFYRIGGSQIIFLNPQGQINQNLWNGCAEGSVIITFYVNNTIGNYSAAEITIYKDSIFPFISTDFIYDGNVYDWTAPFFNLNIYDINLDLKWYTINDNPFKHYFTGENVGIDQELWNYLNDGMILIILHAIDKAGNENSYFFYVIKDTRIVDPYDPPYLAITIGGLLLLGAVVTVIVVVVNKKSQLRAGKRYHDRIQYRSQFEQPEQYRPQLVKPKQSEFQVQKRRIKCPYCSYEEDNNGNFCPQCGARLK